MSKLLIVILDVTPYQKENFKVVSNIPFRITSEILKSLMFDSVEHFYGWFIDNAT